MGRKDRAPWECLGNDCSWRSFCRVGIGEPICGEQLIIENVLWETRKLEEREMANLEVMEYPWLFFGVQVH